jgi:hypothetical protein
MKKKSMILVAVTGLFVTLSFVLVQNASAQTNEEAKVQKTAQKNAKKIYAAKLKEFKKEGWKTASSTKTLEMELFAFAEKREQNPALIVIEGEVGSCKSINVCKQTALTNAQNYYLQLVSGKLKGAFGSVFKANANIPAEEIDKTVGNITKQCEADLSGSLAPCFSLIKESGGLKQYKTVFLADPSRIVATMERSLKETKLTIEEISTITKFVDDEFKKEAENE